jgi:hypothetical protein
MDNKEKYCSLLQESAIPFVNEMFGILPRIKNIHWKNDKATEHKSLDDIQYFVTEIIDASIEQILSQCGRDCLNYGDIEAITYDEVYGLIDFDDFVDYITQKLVTFRNILDSYPEMVGLISLMDDTIKEMNLSKYRGEML